MNSFKFCLHSLIVIILIFTIQTTAHEPDSTQQKVSPLQAGSWSIQFGYNNNLGFTSYKGGNISAKYHFTANSALRFGVNVFFGFANYNSIKPKPFNTGINSYKQKSNIIDIGILTNYVYYFRAKNNINLFISSGTNFGILYFNQRFNGSGWFAGVDFSVGVEWFVAEKFSILGEYETIFKYSYYKKKSISGYNSGVTGWEEIVKSFTVSPSNVLIGVSLYF